MEQVRNINNQHTEINKDDSHNRSDFYVLVEAFAWLLQEDKKQNPQFYKPNKTL